MNSSPTVIYANDPLCGWCFAIGPDLLEAKARLGDLVTWRVECGGLVTGERVRPVADDREYLVAGLANVQARSGRQAGRGYVEKVLEPGTWVSNSEPACRAVLIVRDMAPERVIEFSHGLTDALYLDGDVPDDPSTIRRVAEANMIDADELLLRWSSPEALHSTATNFAHARALGITTYPSLFMDHEDGLEILAAGWASADHLEGLIRSAVAGAE
jgi:putative protein-disulfide isomerase